MTTVHLYPVGDEIPGPIKLHHDFDGPLNDAEASFSQAPSDDPTSNDADVITFHPDRIPALVAALNDLHMQWKRANSPLYRDPATTVAGEW
jgi:hypothetical protein